MILDLKPLNLAEVKELVKDLEDKGEILDYLKKFGKLSKEDSEKLSDELRALDNLKIKEAHLVKVVDLLPTDNSTTTTTTIAVTTPATTALAVAVPALAVAVPAESSSAGKRGQDDDLISQWQISTGKKSRVTPTVTGSASSTGTQA